MTWTDLFLGLLMRVAMFPAGLALAYLFTVYRYDPWMPLLFMLGLPVFGFTVVCALVISSD